MTIAESHSVKASGLDFICDALRQTKAVITTGDMGKEKVDELLGKYKPGKQKKWWLVFCVPQDVGHKWNKWQCIEYQGKKQKHKWEHYIEQFVVEFEAGPGKNKRSRICKT